MTTDRCAALHATLTLAFVPGLGPRKIKLLLEQFGGAAAALAAPPAELRQTEGIGPKLAGTLVAARAAAQSKADAELARAERLGVALLAFGTAAYPAGLAQIYDPPAVLYVRGTLPPGVCTEVQDLRSLGVVGTRNASPYGLGLSRRFARELAAAGVAIVSGLALGVDAAAHEGALEAPGGQTVAVLGSSAEIIYPSQHRRLAERILEQGGAIVSEYRLGTSPRAENFPGRNRIINGLSKGILVVEGGKKSGALITADYALEEGRTIFAVPGRLGDPQAEGALELLKQGAVLTQSTADIASELGWSDFKVSGLGEQQGGRHSGAGRVLTKAAHEQIPVQPIDVKPIPTPSGFPGELTTLIRSRGEPLLDELIVATGKPASELLPTLMTLELQGLIRSLPSGRYSV